MRTIVIKNEYNGKPMFTVVKADDKGEVIPLQKPVVNMGITKAREILKYADELREFVQNNS